jgi:hypothetical protein
MYKNPEVQERKHTHHCTGFEVLTAMVIKYIIFWDITLCSPLKVNRRYEGTYCLHLQSQIS